MNNNGMVALNEAFVAMATALQTVCRTEALPDHSALIIHRQTLLWHGHYGYTDLVTKQVPNLQTIYRDTDSGKADGLQVRSDPRHRNPRLSFSR